MTMYKAINLRDDIGTLYMPRKEEGRGLASIEDSADTSMQRLEDYIKKSKYYYSGQKQHKQHKDQQTTIIRKQNWKKKKLVDISSGNRAKSPHQKTWTWLRKGKLLRETEYLLNAS